MEATGGWTVEVPVHGHERECFEKKDSEDKRKDGIRNGHKAWLLARVRDASCCRQEKSALKQRDQRE